jgi:hypothetical protein
MRRTIWSGALVLLSAGCARAADATQPVAASVTIPGPASAPSRVTATPLVVTGSQIDSEPLGPVLELTCAREPDLRSLASEESLHIVFHNMTQTPLTLTWLDFNGRRVSYATLEPGQSHRQQTYVTHPWLALDADGRCVTAYLPRVPGEYTVRIVGPNRRATTRWNK